MASYRADEPERAHERAHERARTGTEPAQVAHDDAPEAEPGRCRAGLERWLVAEDRQVLPESLVEAARSLADRVDEAPHNSALWARYTDVLGALREADREAEREANVALRDLQLELVTVTDREVERAQRYREAMEAGDEDGMRRWEALGPLPVECSLGRHGRLTASNICERCLMVAREHDGT